MIIPSMKRLGLFQFADSAPFWVSRHSAVLHYINYSENGINVHNEQILIGRKPTTKMILKTIEIFALVIQP